MNGLSFQMINNSTVKQKLAVRFCEQMLNIDFTSNINNFNDCHLFLNEHLHNAKIMYDHLKCEYEAYIDSLD